VFHKLVWIKVDRKVTLLLRFHFGSILCLQSRLKIQLKIASQKCDSKHRSGSAICCKRLIFPVNRKLERGKQLVETTSLECKTQLKKGGSAKEKKKNKVE